MSRDDPSGQCHHGDLDARHHPDAPSFPLAPVFAAYILATAPDALALQLALLALVHRVAIGQAWPRAASLLRRPAFPHAVAGDLSACSWSLRPDRACQAFLGMRSRPQRQVWERRPSAARPTPTGGARSHPASAYAGGTAEANGQSFEIPSSWALLGEYEQKPPL